MQEHDLEARANELLRRAGAEAGEYPAVTDRLLRRRARAHETRWPDDEELLELMRVPPASHLDCCKADFYAMIGRARLTERQRTIVEHLGGVRYYGELAVIADCSVSTVYREIRHIIRVTYRCQGPQWRSMLIEVFGYRACSDALGW